MRAFVDAWMVLMSVETMGINHGKFATRKVSYVAVVLPGACYKYMQYHLSMNIHTTLVALETCLT